MKAPDWYVRPRPPPRPDGAPNASATRPGDRETMTDVSPDDLSVLDPAPRQVTLASGLVVDVLPITVRQLVPFVRALGPARDALAEPGADVWQLIADHGEAITEGLSVALAMPVSAIECLSPGDYMGCLNAVLEANRDFFGSWLLRPTMAAAARTNEAAEVGRMSSPPLSPTDTPEAT